jgi:hypothetical protein
MVRSGLSNIGVKGMHDVADKVGDPGIIGAFAAGLAALALACRPRAQSKVASPEGFPKDPSARLPKYIAAFWQLASHSAEGQVPEKTDTAEQYALKIFNEARGIVASKKETPSAIEKNDQQASGE